MDAVLEKLPVLAQESPTISFDERRQAYKTEYSRTKALPDGSTDTTQYISYASDKEGINVTERLLLRTNQGEGYETTLFVRWIADTKTDAAYQAQPYSVHITHRDAHTSLELAIEFMKNKRIDRVAVANHQFLTGMHVHRKKNEFVMNEKGDHTIDCAGIVQRLSKYGLAITSQSTFNMDATVANALADDAPFSPDSFAKILEIR